MKRSEFIRRIKDAGCIFKRSGKRHDIYENPQTGVSTTVPRHTELANTLCKEIAKQLGLEDW